MLCFVQVAGGKRKNRDKDKGGSEGWSHYQAWPGDSAEFCRFVMYKENMDSHAALSIIERLLNAKKSMLQIAGTKDKRGVTSQHVTVFKASLKT
jgi:tRNA pseudouridine13 synthase